MNLIPLLAVLLWGCADNCKESEKASIVKIATDSCDENQICLVDLSNGKQAIVLSPKIGELVCP